MKHNYLFATLVSEFEYVHDNLLTIKNEDERKTNKFYSISSLDDLKKI